MQQSVSQGMASKPCALIKQFLPDLKPTVIFDVGANVGQSTMVFVQTFPQAAVYAFEPVASTYRTLEGMAGSLERVHTFNTALGRRSAQVYVTAKPSSPSNRVVDAPTVFERHKTETAAMVSGDDFAAEHGVEHVDLLKVDAEGHDLDVLIGFQRMLSAQRIHLIDTEVGMNRANRRHVPFEAMKAYLEPLGYHVLHLHDLAMETPISGRAVLRRANVLFVSEAIVEAHRRAPAAKGKARAAGRT